MVRYTLLSVRAAGMFVVREKIIKGMVTVSMEQNISFMKEYLKYALEFEKYVYIWTNSMNKANKQMQEIYSRRSKLESIRNSAHNSLAALDTRYSSQQNYNSKEATRYKRNANITLVILLIDIMLCLAGGVALACYGFYMKSTQEDYMGIPAILILSVIAAIATFVFTFIGPICIGIYSSNKSKYKKYTEQANPHNIEGSKRRQELILREREIQANNDWAVSVEEESSLCEKQEEISTALQEAKKNLLDIYSKNILPAKYRSLNAVATLYEYLETGRCNTIEGHGGIYDTYETDLQRGIIIETLTDIRDSMYRIEANQQLLYRELQQANRTLSSINSSLTEIEKTNTEIAKNTAISAVANQQTAASARWMAWNAWSNGY